MAAKENTAKSVRKIDMGAQNAKVINTIPLSFITECYRQEVLRYKYQYHLKHQLLWQSLRHA